MSLPEPLAQNPMQAKTRRMSVWVDWTLRRASGVVFRSDGYMDADTTTRTSTGLTWAVLVTAIAQAVAPLLTFNGTDESPGRGAGPDLLITPVDWAFSIWGLIYALAIIQAIAAVAKRDSSISQRIQITQIVLYLGAALWIFMAALGSSLATASALLVMFAAAIVLVITVAQQPPSPSWMAHLTRATVGLYCGWVTAAVFLNISTALADNDVFDSSGPGWQLVMLGIATVALAALVIASRANVAFAAAGLWALVGIIVTGRADGTTSVVVAAAIGAVVLVIVTLGTKVARSD